MLDPPAPLDPLTNKPFEYQVRGNTFTSAPRESKAAMCSTL